VVDLQGTGLLPANALRLDPQRQRPANSAMPVGQTRPRAACNAREIAVQDIPRRLLKTLYGGRPDGNRRIAVIGLIVLGISACSTADRS
jgi:hypothetical protein